MARMLEVHFLLVVVDPSNSMFKEASIFTFSRRGNFEPTTYVTVPPFEGALYNERAAFVFL